MNCETYILRLDSSA